MRLHPPSTPPSEERMYPQDLALHKAFDGKGKAIPGYARALDAYRDCRRGNPLFERKVIVGK